MTTNQQIILDTILDQQKETLADELKADDFFHLFVTEQILKNYELSYDEINEGIVDNGGDGGIDSIYTFVNSELLQIDAEPIDGKRNSTIDVYLIQSKNTNSFSETAVEKCTSSATDLFDLSKPIDDLRSVYNSDLLKNIEAFRNQYLHLASKFPNITFHYFYASKGIEVHPNVTRKVDQLVGQIQTHFDRCNVDFEFITAKKLIEISRKEQIQSKGIDLTDNPISTQDGGYIAIVPLKSYFDFISDENGGLLKYFFDANIRDYQGNVVVNKAIKETLIQTTYDEDFWWLNNGITITASDATFASKKLHIEDPQIVNGLQTSFEIYNYYSNNMVENDNRNLLLRVVKTNDEKSRLNVIKSTNSQTNIPQASLRATDSIHRDIEDYLISKGYYYDRRKNYHKNHGRPIKKIISIPYLAQIVMSLLHQKPDYARARPSTLIKNDSDYAKIFDSNIPIELYYKAIVIQKKVESLLKNFDDPKLTRVQIGDIKFHVSMFLVGRISSVTKIQETHLIEIDLDTIDDGLVNEAISNVYIVYDALGGNNSVAKGKDFVKESLDQLNYLIEKEED